MGGGGGGGGGARELKLQFTPTWIIALVCAAIVVISIFIERRLHHVGKLLKKKNQKTLAQALQKVKEELMILGFISLFLTVAQTPLHSICIPRGWNNYMLPCNKEAKAAEEARFLYNVHTGPRRLLLSASSGGNTCKRGQVPLISLEALHQLHIFIFVLAITHVISTALTMLLGGAKIRQWKYWEDSIKNESKTDEKRNGSGIITHVDQFEFIQDRFKGTGKDSLMLQYLHSFGKQFYGSMNKTDYATLRLGFIMTHCQANPSFDFHKYMVRALEADFKKVVGISWYLWFFGIMFLLLNIDGWHTYFWMAFVPLALLLIVGTKLEHVITQLAHDVAEKQSAVHGDLVVKPSDEHFWLKRPRIMLYLIHFILFQNAFEIAFFFWILATYGWSSCIMDKTEFIIPRLVVGVIIQILCSYSTLPLYAIVTQMGSSFKKAIFDEHLQESLMVWAKQARKRTGNKASSVKSKEDSGHLDEGSSGNIQTRHLLSSSRHVDSLEEGNGRS